MAGITVLADDIAELADVLKGVDDEFAAAARTLRELTPEDVGPPAVAKAVTEVVARLERRLGALATEAGDGARVVRRQLTEFAPPAETPAEESP
jgi:phage FluMu protein gp41